MGEITHQSKDITLVELLDRVVDHGVVLAGDITISVADVDLIYLGLRVLIRTPLDQQIDERRAKEQERNKDSDDFTLRLRDSSTGS